jgi:hypothetical protein
MNKLTITIIVFLIIAIACKKKKDDTFCYYEAMKNGSSIYVWVVYKPTADQIQKVKDTCNCTFTVKESCVPCNGVVTDQGGTAIACY